MTICPTSSVGSRRNPTSNARRGRQLSVAILTVGAALAAGFWGLSASPSSTLLQPRSTMSPAEARQHELLLANIDNPGDVELGRRFHGINVKYFDGKLRQLPVMWEPRLAEVGAMSSNTFTLEGMYGHIGDRAAILLNSSLKGQAEALDRALCHEMVHAYLFSQGDRATTHGPAFQAELQRLSLQGAFTGIVASPDERNRLHSWLTMEAARLAEDAEATRREGDAIVRERADIEAALAQVGSATGQAARDALEERRQAFNRRVESANAHVEKGREGVEHFNREAARYNLMLVYPDGLDEDRSSFRQASASSAGVEDITR